VVAEIASKIPRLSTPMKASIPTRDANPTGVGANHRRVSRGRFRVEGCRARFVGFCAGFRRQGGRNGAVLASHAAGHCSAARVGSALARWHAGLRGECRQFPARDTKAASLARRALIASMLSSDPSAIRHTRACMLLHSENKRAYPAASTL
jgi:hypothetical protein